MAGLNVRKSDIEEIKEHANEEIEPQDFQPSSGNFTSIVSTGSTLLDLAISGGRVRGGGVPGGILIELFGPSSAGKSSVLAEMCASANIRGGNVKFLDPEGRLDKEYAKIYGAEIIKEDYAMPDTVNQLFDEIWQWQPPPVKEGATNLLATDSLAALSSDLEMSPDGDKMGMKIAKDFSAGLRKSCRIIKNSNFLLACTNQVRSGGVGIGSSETTSGGRAVEFYASLRVRIGPPAANKYLKKTATIHGTKHEKIYGVKSNCIVKKSSVDDPYRTADIYIVFGVGIDDVRGNLLFLRDNTKEKKFVVDGEEITDISKAIRLVEENNLEMMIREQTIDLWMDIEDQMRIKRKKKVRF